MNGVINKVVVNLGEPVTATTFAEEFNLTADKEYKVLGYDGECLLIRNDVGAEEWYSIDYFREYADRTN